MKTFTHIVVPTDFSATAHNALKMACAIAKESAAKISVIAVIADVWREPCVQRELEQDVKKQLTALAASEACPGLLVLPVVLFGTPHVEVGRYLENHGADLMVVGSHGHGPVRRFLLGSVADRLVRTARCPVLVVPHDSLRGKQADEPIAVAAGASSATGSDHAPVDEQC